MGNSRARGTHWDQEGRKSWSEGGERRWRRLRPKGKKKAKSGCFGGPKSNSLGGESSLASGTWDDGGGAAGNLLEW